MWLLSWLPDWLFYTIFFVGLLGLLVTYVVKFIPFINTFQEPIRLVSMVAIIFATYMIGRISNEASWKEKVAEMEKKASIAQVESSKQNVKIIEKVVKKTEYITRRGQDIVTYVDREVTKYDAKFAPGGICEIPKEFIKAHNDAAEAPK